MREIVDYNKITIPKTADLGEIKITPNDLERMASKMSEKEKLSIGEQFILTEIRKINGQLCDIQQKLDDIQGKHATQLQLVQTAQALQSQINRSKEKDKTPESKGLSTLEIGKLEDLPVDVLEQFNIGKEAKS